MDYGRRQAAVDVVLDLETCPFPVTGDDIEDYMNSWEPPASVSKPETIEKYRRAAFENAESEIRKARAFHIGGAYVVSAALCCVLEEEVRDMESCTDFDNEAAIAKFIAEYLNDVGHYRLVGFNINEFDLPHVSRMMFLHGHRLLSRPSKWGIVDMLDKFKYRKGHTCKEVARAFGIRPKVPHVDGSHVYEMVQANDVAGVKAYNESDVDLEARLFIALSTVFYKEN